MKVPGTWQMVDERAVLNLRVPGSIPAPLLPGGVTSSMPRHHSEPQFYLLENEDNAPH